MRNPMWAVLALSLLVPAASAQQPADPYAPAKAIVADVNRIVTPSGVQENLVVTLGGARQAVNVRGAWLGLKYAIPAMPRDGGSIIITSSVSGIEGARGLSAYVTSKHAVIGLMRTAALECVPLGIRVNTINPAPLETRMMRALEEGLTPGKATRAREAITAGIPLRRYGTPEEVARMMLFLATDDSRYCTGGVYMVDGGISAG